MPNIEGKTDIYIQKTEPMLSNTQNALKTTPGYYYYDGEAKEMRAEIIEKISMISQGKN